MTTKSTSTLPNSHTRWAWTSATFFGIGYLKPGPGTWGSVAATLLWLAATILHPRPATLALGTLAAALLAIRIGIPAATLVEREASTTDPQHVVLDEVAGQWLALAPAALATSHLTLHALLALALFRLFDITKPPPAPPARKASRRRRHHARRHRRRSLRRSACAAHRTLVVTK